MKSKYIIIVLLIIAIIRPLHAKCLSHETYTYSTLHHIADDSTTRNNEPSEKGYDEQPQDDATNDDSIDHHDSDIDEDLEDIPDDFYDYQEENF